METLKRNIAIVCGGDSSEHDVSMRSAQGLYSFLQLWTYNDDRTGRIVNTLTQQVLTETTLLTL